MSEQHRTTIGRRRALKTGALAAVAAGLGICSTTQPTHADPSPYLMTRLAEHPELAAALERFARAVEQPGDASYAADQYGNIAKLIAIMAEVVEHRSVSPEGVA